MLDRGHGVGYPQRKVLVGVDPDLGRGAEDFTIGIDALGDVAHRKPSARVGHVHAERAVGLHELGLARQRPGGLKWLIIKNPATSMSCWRAQAMC